MHPFPALMLVSLALGLSAGLEPAAVVTAFQQGVGNTLGFIAVVIGLGTFVGALLAESGGAAVVARAAVAAVGERWLPWAVATVGFVIGLPVFFSVGLVLLFPVVVGLAATPASAAHARLAARGGPVGQPWPGGAASGTAGRDRAAWRRYRALDPLWPVRRLPRLCSRRADVSARVAAVRC